MVKRIDTDGYVHEAGVRLDSRRVERLQGFACRPVFTIACVCLFSILAVAQAKDEQTVKAAFVFNLTKYVEWPAGAAGNEIVIGFTGEGSMGQVLKQVLSGKVAGARTVRVIIEPAKEDLQHCNILYIAHSSPQKVRAVLERISNRNVLTVGDTASFAKSGRRGRSGHGRRSRADPDQSGGCGSGSDQDQLPPAQPCNPGRPDAEAGEDTMRVQFAAPNIARKLTLVVVLASGAALFTLGSSFLAYDYIGSRQALEGHLATLAQIVAENSTAAVEFNDPVAAQQVLGALHSDKQVVYACLYNAKGEFFVQYRRDSARYRRRLPQATAEKHGCRRGLRRHCPRARFRR